ncbi:low-specificity L-threonine aldolase [Salmonella enterica]|nr:low-specificity L-threonine aldolase [Salmonella enterica]
MIDLRSDTVTRPGRAMLEAMMTAPVGDDVYGDDPTVNALQRYAADLSGKEAALFLPTGTQANLVALLSHCERGEEYIVGQGAHNYLYEAGGAAVLGSIQPQPIDAAADGTLPLENVAAKIKADDIHFARTRLLSLENTHNGKVLPRAYLKDAWTFTRERGLALHVDGARIFNAVVAYGCELKEITQYCDSFTICLSKGLGTPVGSLLVGNRDYIKRATRWRKMVGGGMRQAGILAAAGLYALKHNVARLQEDHDNAAWLAQQLREAGAEVIRHETNMLFVRVGEAQAAALGDYLRERNILINAAPIVRLVTHLDVSREQLTEAAGPQVLSYQQQFERFMAVSGKRRPLIPVPFPTRWISVWFLNVITSVPPTTAKALIQGLRHDLLADDAALKKLIPQTLITFDDAVRRTLKEEEKLVNSSDWGYDALAFARWRPEYGYFPKQAGFTAQTPASLSALWQVVNRLGGKEGYFFGNILWQTRAAMDRLVGHKLAKGRPSHTLLKPGDTVDSWKVIIVEPEKQLTLLFGMKAPGLGRLSFTLHDKGRYREIDVRAWWHPHGMPGLIYWLLMIPAHLFIFRGMARRIARLAEQITEK